MQIQNWIYNIVTLTTRLSSWKRQSHFAESENSEKFYFHPSRKIPNGNEGVSKNMNSR